MSVFHTARFSILVFAVAGFLCGTGGQAAVQISNKPTRNMSCSSGTCMSTAKTANLNAGDLAGRLAADDVSVISGSAALDIDVEAALTWTSSHRLTLDSQRSIAFSKPVTVAGAGALTLTTNDGGVNGDFSFIGKGHVEFWDLTSSLIINGTSYTLAGSLSGLAADFGNNLSGSFALAKSYDASKDGTYAVSPIAAVFGAFEGLGNTISGFSLRLADHSTLGGLMDCACPGSTVRDVILRNARVRGADNADDVGALAGVAYGTVKGAYASGSVRGSGKAAVNDTVGGLLGLAHNLVIDSHSSAKVSHAAVVGGLVGFLVDGGVGTPTVANSSASGRLSGRGAIGGLVGDVGATRHIEVVEDSFATGAINAARCDACGGLVGSNNGSITNTYASGAMTVASCSACGGLAGTSSGQIASSYSTGAVAASGRFVGGLIGADSSSVGSLASTYWDLDTSGVSNSAAGAGNVSNDAGITGLTDAQLKSALPQGFEANIWQQRAGVNGGYPYLRTAAPQ